MKHSLARLVGSCLIASTLTLFNFAEPVSAQSSNVDTPNTAQTTTNRAEEGFHWGWLGAVGLLGLLGLSGLNRRHSETMTRTTAVRP